MSLSPRPPLQMFHFRLKNLTLRHKSPLLYTVLIHASYTFLCLWVMNGNTWHGTGLPVILERKHRKRGPVHPIASAQLCPQRQVRLMSGGGGVSHGIFCFTLVCTVQHALLAYHKTSMMRWLGNKGRVLTRFIASGAKQWNGNIRHVW